MIFTFCISSSRRLNLQLCQNQTFIEHSETFTRLFPEGEAVMEGKVFTKEGNPYPRSSSYCSVCWAVEQWSLHRSSVGTISLYLHRIKEDFSTWGVKSNTVPLLWSPWWSDLSTRDVLHWPFIPNCCKRSHCLADSSACSLTDIRLASVKVN